MRVSAGSYEVVEGLEVEEFSRAKIDNTVNELREERDAVKELGLVLSRFLKTFTLTRDGAGRSGGVEAPCAS